MRVCHGSVATEFRPHCTQPPARTSSVKFPQSTNGEHVKRRGVSCAELSEYLALSTEVAHHTRRVLTAATQGLSLLVGRLWLLHSWRDLDGRSQQRGKLQTQEGPAT
eukprot:311098-Amphidinium_carterae.1